jgi:hypothetical protein
LTPNWGIGSYCARAPKSYASICFTSSSSFS